MVEINVSLYALKECVRFRRLKFLGVRNLNVYVLYWNSLFICVLVECFVCEDVGVVVIGIMLLVFIDIEYFFAILKTINVIGGNEDSEGYVEEKEDVVVMFCVDVKIG